MSKKPSTSQEFHIHCGVYDFEITVLLSSDKEWCAKTVNRKLGVDYISTNEFENFSGKVFSRKSYSPILWLPQYPTTHDQIGTLAHEMLHIVFEVMEWANITLSHSSEEAFTHLLKYLITQFYEKASK